MQVSWFEVKAKVKRGQASGAGTILSNNLRAVVGQSDDPGMRGTGTDKGCITRLPSYGSGDCKTGAGIVEVDAASR